MRNFTYNIERWNVSPLGSTVKLVLNQVRTFLLLTLFLSFFGFSASGQSPHAQIGLGGWPGAGLQLVHIQSQSIYTLEVLASADTEFWENRTPVFLSVGVGASLRPLGILRLITQANYSYDVDVGIRFGPALTFLQRPTRAEKNRQFSLFLDPFLRYSHPLGKQIGFIEIGAQRPSLRFGIWVPL